MHNGQKLRYLIVTDQLDILRPKRGHPDHCKFNNMYGVHEYVHFRISVLLQNLLNHKIGFHFGKKRAPSPIWRVKLSNGTHPMPKNWNSIWNTVYLNCI